MKFLKRFFNRGIREEQASRVVPGPPPSPPPPPPSSPALLGDPARLKEIAYRLLETLQDNDNDNARRLACDLARCVGLPFDEKRQRPLGTVCVLCGAPWEPGCKNRCECGGFCTWGPYQGAPPSSWMITPVGWVPRPVPARVFEQMDSTTYIPVQNETPPPPPQGPPLVEFREGEKPSL